MSRRISRSRTLALFVAASVVAAASAQCNIWTSLTNCTTDADCTSAERCDLGVSRCVPRPSSTSDAGKPDASFDAGMSDVAVVDSGPPCDTLPWGTPKLVLGLENTPIVSARFSPDELSMVLTKGDALGADTVLSTASRADISSPFHIDGPIPIVNAVGTSAFWPTMSADGLLLFFESDRSRKPDDAGMYSRSGIRIWTASRVNTLDDFSVPRLQSLFDVPVDAVMSESSPYVHPSGRSLYFASSAREGLGGLDIYVANIGSLGTVTSINNIQEVNTTSFELAPVVSLDERYLYYAQYTGDPTRIRIQVAERAGSTGKFTKTGPATALNSQHDEYPSWVSPDHCHFYLISTRPEGGADAGDTFHLWMADRQR